MNEKVVIFGNAQSVHTYNIAYALRSSGSEVTVISLDPCIDTSLADNFAAIAVPIISEARCLRTGFEKYHRQRSFTRLVAVSASVYGQFVAKLEAPSEMKTLICLGTEVMFHAGRDPDIARSIGAFKNVICPSKYLARKALAFVHFNANLYVRNLGIADSWFGTSRIPYVDVRFKRFFVTAKYYKWIYGFETLVEFARAQIGYLRDNDVGFVLVGEGSGYQKKIKALMERYGVADRFQFVRFSSPEEIASLLDRSVGGMYLSEYESYGVTLLETFARGKPAVYWEIPGYSDVTGEFRYGFGCRFGSFDQLREAIHSCCYQEVEVERLCEWARGFSWGQKAAPYVNAIYGNANSDGSELGKVPLFVSKLNILHLLEGRRSIKGARQKRTLEIYRELDKKLNVVPIFNVKSDGLSVVECVNYKNIDFVYVEHGSNYSTYDAKIDEYLGRADTRIVNYLSDYHALSPMYYLSVNKNLKRYVTARLQARLRLENLKRFRNVIAASPTQSVGLATGLSEKGTIVLPPGIEEGGWLDLDAVDIPSASTVAHAQLVYTGGLGPFYDLTRQMIWALEAEIQQVFYVRHKELRTLSPSLQKAFEMEGVEVHFDQNFDHVFKHQGRLSVGSLLMEPIPYIRSSYPVKLMSYLRKAMPVAAYHHTEIGDIVLQNGLGFLVSKESNLREELQSYLSKFDADVFKANVERFMRENTWSKRVEVIQNAVL